MKTKKEKKPKAPKVPKAPKATYYVEQREPVPRVARKKHVDLEQAVAKEMTRRLDEEPTRSVRRKFCGDEQRLAFLESGT